MIKLTMAWQQFRDAVSPQLFISMDAHCPPSNPPPISSTTPNPKCLRLESHTSDTTPVKVNKTPAGGHEAECPGQRKARMRHGFTVLGCVIFQLRIPQTLACHSIARSIRTYVTHS